MQPQEAYQELLTRVREQSILSCCSALLEWDELTYLPPGGFAGRGDQAAFLAGLEHERATDPRLGELLGCLEGSALLGEPHSAEAVNVREIRRNFQRASRLPRQLVEEMARVASLAQHHWDLARKKKNFSRIRPWLEKIVALKIQEAECLGYQGARYDALLEDYEPGARSDDIARLFESLRRDLQPLLGAILGAKRKPDVAILLRRYPISRQRKLAAEVAAALGFDFQRGRIDAALHPFSTHIGPGDCRMAVRYCLTNFCDFFFALLHEVGHALYTQGLDPEHVGTPLGEPASLGMHESQSRLWENVVGRSRAFWTHFFPRVRLAFPAALNGVKLDDFYFALNDVEPSLNRIRADEVTYNLHILVRFELERALIQGDLQVADLPAAWNEGYRNYLGLVPPDDAQGCLQDGHWFEGLIGYFPTYTLGNLFAAQLFARAQADLGDLDKSFARGRFDDLLGWLRLKVHRHGSRFSAAQLIHQATGSVPDHRPLVEALRQRYGELYEL